MTDHYAVIGNPMAQSKSPLIHGLFAQACEQDMVYTKIEVPLDGFAAAVDGSGLTGARGSTSRRRSSSTPVPMPPRPPLGSSWLVRPTS